MLKGYFTVTYFHKIMLWTIRSSAISKIPRVNEMKRWISEQYDMKNISPKWHGLFQKKKVLHRGNFSYPRVQETHVNPLGSRVENQKYLHEIREKLSSNPNVPVLLINFIPFSHSLSLYILLVTCDVLRGKIPKFRRYRIWFE